MGHVSSLIFEMAQLRETLPYQTTTLEHLMSTLCELGIDSVVKDMIDQTSLSNFHMENIAASIKNALEMSCSVTK